MTSADNHPSPNETRGEIVAVIGDSVYQALGLKECLNDERQALEDQDAGALSFAVESKGKCISKLQSLEIERSRISEDAGFRAGPEQMEHLQAWCDDGATIANGWQHLMDIAAQCSDLNRRNGAIIRLRKQQIDSNLTIVRGGSSEADTYGRDGTESGGQLNRPLAKA